MAVLPCPTRPPVASLPLRIYAPIASVWTPNKYAEPDAPLPQLARQWTQHQGRYVSNHRASVLLYVSKGVEQRLGHPAAAFAARQCKLIHPDDLSVVAVAAVPVNRYIDYPPRPRAGYAAVHRHTACATWPGTTRGCCARISNSRAKSYYGAMVGSAVSTRTSARRRGAGGSRAQTESPAAAPAGAHAGGWPAAPGPRRGQRRDAGARQIRRARSHNGAMVGTAVASRYPAARAESGATSARPVAGAASRGASRGWLAHS